MNDATDTTSQTITAQRGHIQALAFARKGGAALNSLLTSIAVTKQAERKGPIMTMIFLEANYSDEEGAAIPEVGSKQGETGNKPYDRYTTEIKTADGKRKVPGSWFTDAIKTTDKWGEINARIELLDQAQGEGVPEDILSMSSGQRAQEKAELRQFIADMRTALTKGAMLYHQCEAIRLMNPDRVKIKLPVMTQKDKDGKPVQVVTGNTIRLQDPSGELEDEVVTVGSFLQYDPDKAAKDPDKGTIKSLKATASKAPKKSKGTGTAPTVPATLEQVLTLFNVLASGLDNGTEHGKKLESQLLAACAKDGPEGDEAVISVGNVCLAADNIWTVINTRYNTIMAKKAATLNTKAA